MHRLFAAVAEALNKIPDAITGPPSDAMTPPSQPAPAANSNGNGRPPGTRSAAISATSGVGAVGLLLFLLTQVSAVTQQLTGATAELGELRRGLADMAANQANTAATAAAAIGKLDALGTRCADNERRITAAEGEARRLDDKIDAREEIVRAWVINLVRQTPGDRIGLRAPDPAGRLSQLVAAVRAVDRASPGDWTADGRPRAESLARLTGNPVSAAERDAAWSAHLILTSAEAAAPPAGPPEPAARAPP